MQQMSSEFNRTTLADERDRNSAPISALGPAQAQPQTSRFEQVFAQTQVREWLSLLRLPIFNTIAE